MLGSPAGLNPEVCEAGGPGGGPGGGGGCRGAPVNSTGLTVVLLLETSSLPCSASDGQDEGGGGGYWGMAMLPPEAWTP